MKKLLTFLTLLTLFFGVGWATDVTYTFTSKSWAATPANWTGTADGNQFNTNQSPAGVQITTGKSGMTVTCPTSYPNISKVVVTYTSTGKGVGSIAVSIGGTSIGSQNIAKSQTSTGLTFTPSTPTTGIVSFVPTCTTNSFAINSVTITYSEGGTQTVATPTFSPVAGTYYEPQSVTLSCTTTGATIRYTTDGTDPTATTGTVYSGPISVSSTTTIKAIATASGYDPSSVASATYTIYSPETVTLPYSENFAGTFGDFYKRDVTGTNIWQTNSGYAKASGYSGGATASESWLISPYIDMTDAASPELTFSHAGNYFNSQANMESDVTLKVKKQSDTQWSDLTINTWPDGASWTFADNTTSLASYAGEIIQIAFVYTSSTSRAGTWEIKNLTVEDASAPEYYLAGDFNSWTQNDGYKFTESNGVCTLEGVTISDGQEFKIIKVDNGTTTWYGGNGGGAHYGIHGGHHDNINLVQDNDNFYLEVGGETDFSFTLNNGTPSVLTVSRDPQLYISGDINSWGKTAMTSSSDGWTMNADFASTNQFGFYNEWGSWYGGEGYWIYQANDMGNPLTLKSSGNFYMVDAGNYNLVVNTALTTLTVTSTAGDTYTLVTSAGDLNTTDSYIIVSKDYESAMGEQGTNNRRGAEVSINGNNAIATDAVEVFSLVANGNGWHFKATKIEPGYLYASSGSSNQLKTEAEPDANGNALANISIASSGEASVVFQGNNSRNVMQYNSGSDLFACYGSASQSPVYIYKKGSTTPPSDQVATPSITPGSTDVTDPYYVYGGKQVITITCATSGATIYYTTDGSNPTTNSNQYSEPFDLTSSGGNVTVKAIAVKADLDDSEIAASYYRFTNPKAPTFDPVTGAVRTGAFDVTINSEYDDAEIYYMLDVASEPTPTVLSTTGTLYNGPVNVSGEGSHTIYAMVVRNGIKSSVAKASYTITSGSTTGDGDYVKVTTSDDLTDGEYLIVFEGDDEDGPLAFNGALSTLDAIGNNIEVEINNFTIPSTPTVDAAVFTYDSETGTLKSASGYYIGMTSYANGLESSQSIAYTNTITFDGDGNAVITAEEGCTMRFNSASNQMRFRYYKSGQQPVALYKKVDNATVATPVITPGSKAMTEAFDATITCTTTGATIYYTLDGSDPTTSSSVYSEPIHIAEPTVTLKAIAEKDGELSHIATAVYSGVWVNNIAEYNALPAGTEDIVFKNPVIVQYHYISGSGKSYIYVKDDSGCAYFHQPGGAIAQLENGDIIGAGFYGDKTPDEMVSDEESNFFMLTNLVNFAPNGDKGLADPEHETVAHIANATTGVALNNHYITIKKVKLSALYQPSTITYGGAKYFDIDNVAHIGYNKFNIDYNTVVDDLTAYYNITGIQTAYNNVMEFHPTEIVKWEASTVTLRQLCDEGVTTDGENEYTISNNLMCVYANGNSIWVKDDTGQSIWMATPDEEDQNFEVYAEAAEGIPANSRLQQAYYDQSNWCEIVLAEDNDTQPSAFVGQIIKGGCIQGNFTDKLNPKLENVYLDGDKDIYSEGTYAPNYYMPANFLGSQKCEAASHNDYNTSYFFMTPKPQEFAQIVWAVWDASSTSMIMSTDDQRNGHRFAGDFEINLSMNTGASTFSDLTNGATYNFTAIVRMVSGSGSKAEGDSYKVYPLDLDGQNPATAINTIEAGNGDIKSVKYVNVAGIVSDVPFQGVNIVVTEYTDGTRTTTKMLKK